jgi:hypothetical protein
MLARDRWQLSVRASRTTRPARFAQRFGRSMFNLLGVSLLQPEHVVSARMPGGAGALGAFLTSIQDLLRARYDDSAPSASRTLCVAIGPQARLQLWLATATINDAPSADEQAVLRELATHIPVPEMHDGPIAIALVFAIGDEPPAEAELTIPDEWRAIIQASDTAPSVEQIITRIWSSG